MSDEVGFLRAILASPSDITTRLVYADWLEECGDQRAEYLRVDAEIEQLKLEGKSDLVAEQRFAEAAMAVDPNWLAFLTTLARPFRECPPSEDEFDYEYSDLPFADRIGKRGRVVTFGTQFTDPQTWDPGLPQDLRFLSELKLEPSSYGAAELPVHPFLCELSVDRRPLTGADVLAAVKARQFRSGYIRNLEATTIPYPGYHPFRVNDGIGNDEIHNDFVGQYIFDHENKDAFEGNHGALKRYVVGGALWYVLLHPTRHDGYAYYVILLAIGCSPHGRRLVGVITQTMCHSMCD